MQQTTLRTERPRRGFTLIEMLMSILVIGVLLSLVIVAAVHVTRLAKDTVNSQTLRSISAAMAQFKTENGILPPLVRDQQASNNVTQVTLGSPAKTYVNVLFRDKAQNDADQVLLRTQTVTDASNPFGGAGFGQRDRRYSERSLAVYLLGAMNALDINNTLPLDGVLGLGSYKAFGDGSFDIPKSVRDRANSSNPNAEPNRGGGKVLGPYLEASAGKIVFTDSSDDHTVTLVDAKNVPFRYYRWLQGVKTPDPANPGAFIYPVTETKDLNIPAMVGRDSTQEPYLTAFAGVKVPADRDISKNPALRSATWAVVLAGRNGAFGDEDQADLEKLLGRSLPTAADLLKGRIEAEADNLVEVGQ